MPVETVKIKGGPPTGTPPAAILEQRERERAALATKDVPVTSSAPARVVSKPEPPKRKLYPVSLALSIPASEAGGESWVNVNFMSPSVSVTASCISVAFEDGFGFVPGGIIDLVIKYGGSEYPVTFLGSQFEFAELDLRGVSFTRKVQQ